MNIIFTDIDGVLNPDWNKKWKKSCIKLYNQICDEFNLIPVITSTWRLNYTKPELQQIFHQQGITAQILDYTPNLDDIDRGLEIKEWFKLNQHLEIKNWIILDDKVDDITPHIKLENQNKIIKCFGLDGITNKEYNKIKNILQ